jgi:hypothetical protein
MEALLTKLVFVGSISLRLVILYLLVKRRLQRRFFWFLAYIVYALIEGLLRLIVSGNSGLYAKVYWFTEIGDVILLIAAVAESFVNVFREFTRLRWFMWTVWVFVGLAVLYSLFKAWIFPPVHASRLGSVIIAVEVTVDYSVTVIGILFFLCMLFFRMKERPWEMGIIGGFSINAGLAVFGPLTFSAFGTKFRLVSAWIPAIAYLLAEIMWLIYLWRPERKMAVPNREPNIDDVGRMDDYAKILKRFLGRKS